MATSHETRNCLKDDIFAPVVFAFLDLSDGKADDCQECSHHGRDH